MALFGAAPAAATSTTGDISSDKPVQPLPEDSISDLKFSPVADFLAVSSWDATVTIYKIDNGVATPVLKFKCKGPVLSVAWSTVSALSSCDGAR